MRKFGQTPSTLPPFEEFQKQFRSAFGRELTREERRFYRLVNIILQETRFPAAAVQATNRREMA